MTQKEILVDGGTVVLRLGVGEDHRLRQLSFGGPAASAVPDPGTAGIPTALFPLAYPTFGEEPLRDPALRMTHADGATSTRLVFQGDEQSVHRHGLDHRITLADRVAPVRVVLCYRTWPGYGVIEQWVEVTNTSARPGAVTTVHRVASSAPAFGGGDPHLTHWGGGWAHEWTETCERLAPGTKTVASAGGVRSALYRSPVVLVAPDGPAGETTGSVALATVAWGGDVRFDAEVALHRQLRLHAGAQHLGAERHLDPGDTYVTPAALWTWSDHGIGPTSRTLHRFVRDHVARDGRRRRATVVNTWEAVGFSLAPEGLAAQVDAAAEMGAELFLLDDGWFGTAHPRDDDTTGLGDWEVDRRKLPDGLQPLIDHTIDQGLRFGLWVEPEMVNPRSALYEAHPDWVIAEPGRDRREERQQLVLDLCRPEVAEHCVAVIDRILAEHTAITYLKWDANRDITEPGSTALPADRQSHLAVDRVHATWAVMAEVARRHPDVELMLCASGGGRSDLATLRWFHELWTSDDTDPVERVRIQWGASHLLPASVLAAHVTRWGERPFGFTCAVAMSGRFGFDVDLRSLSEDDATTARAATARYGPIAELVQFGELHRLVSPVASPWGAIAYLAGDGSRAVVFGFHLPAAPDVPADRRDGDDGDPPPIRVPGLRPDQRYRVQELTPAPGDLPAPGQHGGGELGDGSLPWPPGPAPAACVWLLEAVGSSRSRTAR